MFDGIHLHRAGVREQLVVAEQRGSAANAAVHTLHHRAQTPLQRPEAAFDSPDGASGIMFRFDMAQRAHDLVEQALACFDFQIVRCLVVVRRRLDFRQSRLDVFLLPVERVDLQLHIPLRIDFSDALLQSCDTFRIRVDDHQHRTTIVGCDSSRQFLHGPSQHFDGDFGHFHGSVFIAIRRQQRQQEVGEQQGYDDHATCDEDQFVTHGEPRASRNGVRDREHQ